MYEPDTDGRRGVQTAGALAMALVMLLSMVAIGGASVAAQPADASADSLGDSPVVASSHIPGTSDLDSDEFLVDDDFTPGEVGDDDQLYPNISSAVSQAGDGFTFVGDDGDNVIEVLATSRRRT